MSYRFFSRKTVLPLAASLLATFGAAGASHADPPLIHSQETPFIYPDSEKILRSILTKKRQNTPKPGQNLSTFKIVIDPTPGLAANPAALAAFQRASALWETRISDPITIHISADLTNMGNSGIIGGTSAVVLGIQYSNLRPLLLDDADADDQLLSFLPTASPAFTKPVNVGLSTQFYVNKANVKALGVDQATLDAQFGQSDGNITFNTLFAFDYDNSNGVGVGLMDFETVAAHEIGHLLGFVSAADDINYGATTAHPYPLDLFRFPTANTPTTSAQFTALSRQITPAQAASWSDTASKFSMSTGASGFGFSGTDGRQASHWKDNDLTGSLIGIMDPTLDYRQIFPMTDADFRSMDLIGYDVLMTDPDVEVGGTVGLQGLATGAAARMVTFDFRPVGGGSTITYTKQIGATAALSEFSFKVPPGDYQLAIKASSYLRTVVAVTATGSQLVTVPPVTLLAGDINDDNKVNLTDLVQLRGNYGKTATGLKGDLNGDGKVNLTDLVMLRGNYGKNGQP